MNRVDKFAQKRHQMMQEEELRLTLIKTNPNLNRFYQQCKTLVGDFDLSLLKENKFLVNDYNIAIDFDQDKIDMEELKNILIEANNLANENPAHDYSDAFDDEFYNSNYFKSILPWENSSWRGVVKQVILNNDKIRDNNEQKD